MLFRYCVCRRVLITGKYCRICLRLQQFARETMGSAPSSEPCDAAHVDLTGESAVTTPVSSTTGTVPDPTTVALQMTGIVPDPTTVSPQMTGMPPDGGVLHEVKRALSRKELGLSPLFLKEGFLFRKGFVWHCCLSPPLYTPLAKRKRVPTLLAEVMF